jgi:hypothetical protein
MKILAEAFIGLSLRKCSMHMLLGRGVSPQTIANYPFLRKGLGDG